MCPRPVDVRQPDREPKDIREGRPQTEPTREPHQSVVRETVDENLDPGATQFPRPRGETRGIRVRSWMEDPPTPAGREPPEQLKRSRVELRARAGLYR